MPQKMKDTIKTKLDVSDEVLDRAYELAKRKLNHIISRYGTENGIRETEEYFFGIVLEQVRSLAYSEFTMAVFKAKKEQVA